MATDMADENTQPDSQKQRWLKYGSNVAIGSIVVIALAVLLIYLAQSAHRRIDTTRGGLYSLKPQTLNIIKDLKSSVKLISLYTTVAAEGTDPGASSQEQANNPDANAPPNEAPASGEPTTDSALPLPQQAPADQPGQ